MDDTRIPFHGSMRELAKCERSRADRGRSRQHVSLNRRAFVAGLGVSLLTSQIGCSLFTMAGKVLFGDPVVNCEFTQSTGTNLIRTRDTIMVIATAPSVVQSQYPSITLDIQDGVTRRLGRQGISTIKPDDVSSWADDHGGSLEDIDALAADFDANYIIQVEVHNFSHFEENSDKLYRGHIQSDLSVYQVTATDGESRAMPVFTREFTMRYPKNYSVSVDEKSDIVFQKEYLDRVTHQIALRFYNHRVSEEID